MKNCNCSAVDISHYVYRNLQATETSKLQLIIALYVVYIWLIVFILTSYTIFIATSSFYDQGDHSPDTLKFPDISRFFRQVQISDNVLKISIFESAPKFPPNGVLSPKFLTIKFQQTH